MKVLYESHADGQAVTIMCDHCGEPVWKVRGELKDSTLETRPDSYVYCSACMQYVVLTDEQYEDPLPPF